MKNVGKEFENQIQKSFKDRGIWIKREKDTPSSFGAFGNQTVRFTLSSPYDFEAYDYPNLIFMELKSVQTKSVSFCKYIFILNVIPATKSCGILKNKNKKTFWKIPQVNSSTGNR